MLRNSDAEALLDQLDAAHDRDAEQIETMLMAFERASPAVRERMRVSGNPCDRQRWLNGYAYGKANQALRFRAEPALELGLLALCVHNFACDFRDDYVVLAHLFYVADRIAADRMALARRIGAFASDEGAQHMVRFAERPERDRALSAFGLHEFQTQEGPEVRSVPLGWTPDQPAPPSDWGRGLVNDLLKKWGARSSKKR